MLGEAISAGGGMGLGGLLGQVGGALSYPRRALWSALGLPEHGSELLGQMGMDEQSPLTQALGMGAEMVGDPLSYMGALGGVAGKLGLGRLARTGTLAEEAGNVARPVTNLGTIEAKAINPLGGFPDYVPPVQAGGTQSESAIWKALNADAEQSVARDAAQAAQATAPEEIPYRHLTDARRYMQEQFPGYYNPRELDLPQMHGLYNDLHEDLLAGANPVDLLKPRMQLLHDIGQGESARFPMFQADDPLLMEMNPGWSESVAAQTPKLSVDEATRLARMRDESTLIHELLSYETPAGERLHLLQGVRPEEHGSLMYQMGDAAKAFETPLASVGGATNSPLSQLYGRANEALTGELAPGDLSGLIAELGGHGIPVDPQAMGNAYLASSREGLSYHVPYVLRDIVEGMEPSAGSLGNIERWVGPQGVQHMMDQFGQLREQPFFSMEMLRGAPEATQRMQPLLAELMKMVSGRAGIA